MIYRPGSSKDHVHMHMEYAPNKSISEIVKRLK
ncbi:MAG: transposase, partial [Cytophagaceae bacterium]|nr:transposase [Cytophagaceae bacterium]